MCSRRLSLASFGMGRVQLVYSCKSMDCELRRQQKKGGTINMSITERICGEKSGFRGYNVTLGKFLSL